MADKPGIQRRAVTLRMEFRLQRTREEGFPPDRGEYETLELLLCVF